MSFVHPLTTINRKATTPFRMLADSEAYRVFEQCGSALTYRQTFDMRDSLGFDYAGVIERVATSHRGRVVSEDTLFVNRALEASL